MGQIRGARIIYGKTDSELWALCLYLKSDMSSVSDKTIMESIKEMQRESENH